MSLGRARGRGALIGAGIGFGGSVAVGLVCQVACPSESANLAVAGGLIVGIFIGVPAGAALGALAFTPERWDPVPIR